MTEVVQILSQECLQLFPVLILGSGASGMHGVRGMSFLKDHLIASIEPQNSKEKKNWRDLCHTMENSLDLEKALQKIQLTRSLLDMVIRETRSFILSDDLQVFREVIKGKKKLALSRLYQHLFQSTFSVLSVVTTNYDRLAEYAADAVRLNWTTGFGHGYLPHFNPIEDHPRGNQGRKRTVEIWKVHGSVDWFRDVDGLPRKIPLETNPPHNLKPLLVTPGLTKYMETHQEPFRTIISQADRALSNARAVLCVGYGFNDDHIQPKLMERVREQAIPVGILSRTLTPAAKTFLGKFQDSPIFALEKNGTTTKAYLPKERKPLIIPNTKLWTLNSFLDTAIGP